MRTAERNMGNRARWIKRWPPHRATRRAHLGEYKNCEYPHRRGILRAAEIPESED